MERPIRVTNPGPLQSQAIFSNNDKTSTLYISGQLPADAQGNLKTDEPLSEQAKACIANLDAIVKEAHPEATLKNIVKCTVFLTDMANFAEVNKGYEEAFRGHKPARSCVAVRQLPKGVPVEIEAIAVI